MKLKLIVNNLDWRARMDLGVSNEDWVAWAKSLGANLMILPEAAGPEAFVAAGMKVVFSPAPKGSGWGTAIVVDAGVEIRRITHVKNKEYVLDKHFPGTVVAADVFIEGKLFATIIGLHIKFRKTGGKITSDPARDLLTILPDIQAIHEERNAPLIIGGDFNFPMSDVPYCFKETAPGGIELVDPFAQLNPKTFRQRHGRELWRLDHLYLSTDLASKVTARRGGIGDFPDAFSRSDHAPLLLEIDMDLDSVTCACGAKLRRADGNYATSIRCPRCQRITPYERPQPGDPSKVLNPTTKN